VYLATIGNYEGGLHLGSPFCFVNPDEIEREICSFGFLDLTHYGIAINLTSAVVSISVKWGECWLGDTEPH